jgi:hypothetical protein
MFMSSTTNREIEFGIMSSRLMMTGLFDRSVGMKEDMMKPIRKYFTLETAPRQTDKWLITCERCGNQWHLPKDNKHPGNVLHLLNHARGHDEPKPHGRRKLAAIDALNHNKL